MLSREELKRSFESVEDAWAWFEKRVRKRVRLTGSILPVILMDGKEELQLLVGRYQNPEEEKAFYNSASLLMLVEESDFYLLALEGYLQTDDENRAEVVYIIGASRDTDPFVLIYRKKKGRKLKLIEKVFDGDEDDDRLHLLPDLPDDPIEKKFQQKQAQEVLREVGVRRHVRYRS